MSRWFCWEHSLISGAWDNSLACTGCWDSLQTQLLPGAETCRVVRGGSMSWGFTAHHVFSAGV